MIPGGVSLAGEMKLPAEIKRLIGKEEWRTRGKHIP